MERLRSSLQHIWRSGIVGKGVLIGFPSFFLCICVLLVAPSPTKSPLSSPEDTTDSTSGGSAGIGGAVADQPGSPTPSLPPTPTRLPLPQDATIDGWEIQVTDIALASDLNEKADGQWIIVRGRITNREQERPIGQEELMLRTPAGVIRLNRAASSEVAERFKVEHIGKFGGIKVFEGNSLDWAIAFDAPTTVDDLWFTVEGHDMINILALPSLTSLPTLTPTRTPLPTRTPRPRTPTPVRTKTPVPTDTPTPDVGSDSGAFVACQDAVKQQLIHPSTADFPLLDYANTQIDANTWKIYSFVTAQNSFGVELQFEWTCTTTYEGNHRWSFSEVYLQER